MKIKSIILTVLCIGFLLHVSAATIKAAPEACFYLFSGKQVPVRESHQWSYDEALEQMQLFQDSYNEWLKRLVPPLKTLLLSGWPPTGGDYGVLEHLSQDPYINSLPKHLSFLIRATVL